jgi:hypothetical protein
VKISRASSTYGVFFIQFPSSRASGHSKKQRYSLDTFDGAKPRFLNRGKKRRSVSTLSPSAILGALSLSKGIPRVLVLSAVEGSDRGVEWVDFFRHYDYF